MVLASDYIYITVSFLEVNRSPVRFPRFHFRLVLAGMKYEPLLHVVLYQPEIPPNTGNIGRTCVAVGAKLWLVKPLGFQIDEKQLRRAGLDYWPHLEWEAVENWGELTQKLAAPLAERRIWLLTKTASQAYTSAAFEKGDILLFGNESSGLPAELRGPYSDRMLRIPMRCEVRSLNLSAAAAAVISEAVRQLKPAIS
jgi:tRNA (cytidine/uridine-2'-O-)-methyltransferase